MTSPSSHCLHPALLIDHERHGTSTDSTVVVDLATIVFRRNLGDLEPFSASRTLNCLPIHLRENSAESTVLKYFSGSPLFGMQILDLLTREKEIPAMGIEPILPRKRDFESRASTNSATPASSLKSGRSLSRSERSVKHPKRGTC